MASLNPNSPPYFTTTLHASPPPLPPPPPPLPRLYYHHHFPLLPAHPSFSYYIPPFHFHKLSYPKCNVIPRLSLLLPPPSSAAPSQEAVPAVKEVQVPSGEKLGSACGGNVNVNGAPHDCWRPKKLSAPPPCRWRLRASRKQRTALPPCSPADFRFREEEVSSGGGRTTVMIKNIPNWFKYDKKKVLEVLDNHCLKENQKLQLDGNANNANATTTSEFDFLYLPMDFRSGSNLGYGFVNFTSPIAACRLFQELNEKSWDSHSSGSRKVCEVTYARIQGLDALLSHFRSSTFACASAEYLPVHFTPSRDGLRQTQQQHVGKHVAKEHKPTV